MDDTHDVSVEIASNIQGRSHIPIELHKSFLQPLKLACVNCPRKAVNAI